MDGQRPGDIGKDMRLTVSATVNTALLDSILAGLKPNTEEALQATCTAIETDIKATIQAKKIIDTGNLLNSIHFEQESQLIFMVSDGTDYGVYQELGTRRGIVARPFFVPSVEKNATTMYEKLGNVFK